MSWIQIPEGKTEVRLADGSWTKIPEGTKEVDSSKLWKEEGSLNPQSIPEVDMSTKQAPIPVEPISTSETSISDSLGRLKDEANVLIDEPLKLMARGASRPVLGLMRLSENIANSLGLETNVVKHIISSNEESISNKLSEMGFKDDSIINPANAGQILTEALPATKIDKFRYLSPTEGVVAGMGSYGEGKTKEEALQTGLVASTIVAGVGGVNKVAKKVLAKNTSGLTDEAKTVASKMGITDNEALSLVSGLEKSEQAFELAKQGGAKTKGLMEGAFADSVKAKSKYLDELSARRKAILESAGSTDYTRIKNATKREFATMKNYVDDISSSAYDTSRFVDDLELLQKTGSKTDATDRNIIGMIDTINEKPIKSVGELVELRGEINHELGKATGERAVKWKAFKNDLDKFMKANIDEEVYKMVETSTESYKRMKQQGELLELISDSQKVLGGDTKGEVGAIDWSKLAKSMKESGLDSIEAKNAMKLTKKFKNKFGDMDANYFAKSLPAKKLDTIQTFTSDPASAVRVLANRTGVSWLMRQFDADKSAQKVIADAMEKSNSKAEFFNNVIANKNTPKRIKDEMKALLDGVADITPENIKKQKIVTVKKQKEAQLVQTRVNSADLAVQKQEDRLFSMEEKLGKMESKLAEKPSDSLEARIQRLEKQIDLANKDLEIKIQKHSQVKDEYDKLSVDIEDMDLFNPMRPKASKPKVTKQ